MSSNALLCSSDELFPLSWVAQYGYCPRRCGLLALDQVWCDSADTVEGSAQHTRAHSPHVESRGAVLQVFEMPIYSRNLGINGKCDCVELHESASGVHIPYKDGRFLLYPIEYKHGISRDAHEYNLQLCAQAMCLEEMYGCQIPEGAVFYIESHRRNKVFFDDSLRDDTLSVIRTIQEMLLSQLVPTAVYTSKCKKCSMLNYCEPTLRANADTYCADVWKIALGDDIP